MSHSENAYQYMLIASSQYQQPKHYHDDLYTHDLNTLVNHNPSHFFWVLRDCGTHIILPELSPDWAIVIAQNYQDGRDNCHCFEYADSIMSPISPNDMYTKVLNIMIHNARYHPDPDIRVSTIKALNAYVKHWQLYQHS